MSSALPAALISLQQRDCLTLAVLTAVGYDYILTFSHEIEYIWSKRWTWVSTLFILVRYAGLYNLAVPTLVGSGFVPGPAMSKGEVMTIINGWSFVLFVGGADFVMILRIWAMYNRSRLILVALLILFSAEIISVALTASMYSNPRDQLPAVFEISDFSICVVDSNTPLIWAQVSTALQVAHGATMCILAIIQFVRQSRQMYHITKKWQINHYMDLLAKQGVLYFVTICLFNIIYILIVLGKAPTEGWRAYLLFVIEYVPMYTLTPRFIMGIRELHARKVQGACGEGIDTGFGLPSSPAAARSMIVFADVAANEGSECVEEMPMEGVTISEE